MNRDYERHMRQNTVMDSFKTSWSNKYLTLPNVFSRDLMITYALDTKICVRPDLRVIC